VGNLHLRFDEGRVGRAHCVALSPTLPARLQGVSEPRPRRLAPPMFVVFAEIPHAFEVVAEHVAIVMRQAIVVDYFMQIPDHFIEFAFVVTVMLQAVLQFIQLTPGAVEAVLIVAARIPAVLDLIEVLAHLREQMHAPALAFPSSIAILRVRSGRKEQKRRGCQTSPNHFVHG